MKRSVELWKRYSEEYGFSFEQTGYLFLLYDDDEVEEFKRNIEIQNRFGVPPTRLITPEEAKEIVPPLLDISEVVAASWNPTDGKADPPFHATSAFAINAERLGGAKLVEYTEVKDFVTENGGDKGGAQDEQGDDKDRHRGERHQRLGQAHQRDGRDKG